MPMFRLKCKDCGEIFEDFRTIIDQKEQGACLSCGSGNLERVEKLELECECGCGCGGGDPRSNQGCC